VIGVPAYATLICYLYAARKFIAVELSEQSR
jgi:hypothetical protein